MMPIVSRHLNMKSSADATANVNGASYGHEPLVFADVYREEINMVIWQRDMSESLRASSRQLLSSNPNFQMAMKVPLSNVRTCVNRKLGSCDHLALVDDIIGLIDIFCCLFGVSQAGLRLSALNRAMCPKFHVDSVQCRLLTTYVGVATQWLSNEAVDRTKLGANSHGLSDDESGLYRQQEDVRQLECGDVALLKGALWEGCQHKGLVHRSPVVTDGEDRLLLTLDLVD